VHRHPATPIPALWITPVQTHQTVHHSPRFMIMEDQAGQSVPNSPS
jgi:hypothetical protein